ncbi:MAG: HlyD family efflux transporter periplasmic adaptor subunit [Pseudomonadota bacterium]
MSRQLVYSMALLAGAFVIAAIMIALRPVPVEEERVETVPLVEVVELASASGPIPVLGSGTVQARDEVTIGAEVSGRLTYVHPSFREGGVVPKGATLLRIDESDYINQVRVAEADVAAQGIAVLEAEGEVEIAREELQRFAERQRSSSQEGAGESRILMPRAMENPQDNPEADASIQADAPIQADGASAAKLSLATRKPQLESAKASRDRAEANLSDAQIRLGRTRVRAPFGGLVREESAAIGQLVQPGEPLGSLVSTSAYEVRVSLTADEAALVPGLLNASKSRVPASVTYTYGGLTYRWPAFVDRANAILDSATRNIEVYVRVPAPLTGGRIVDAREGEARGGGRAPPLLLGAFVNVEITGASIASYATVPADAVRPGNEIWVVREGQLTVLKVRVIQRNDEIAYITTPTLAQGGRLITSSLNAPIEGMPLRVAGAKTRVAGAKAAPPPQANAPEDSAK